MKFGKLAISRFIIAGVINTSLTYCLYVFLLMWLPYTFAYSVTYLAGLILGYVLNVYWVFETRPNINTAIKYPMIYVFNYLFGTMLMRILVELLGVDRVIAPILVTLLVVPSMYVLTHFIFRGK